MRQYTLILPALLCSACGMTTSQPFMPTSCAGALPASSLADADNDGLDDAQELAWAQQYLPYLSVAPDDGCPVSGIVVRVSPHPAGGGLIQIRYDVLYDADCGI